MKLNLLAPCSGYWARITLKVTLVALVGAHLRMLLGQQPPHLGTLVHGGHRITVGSVGLGNSTSCLLGMHVPGSGFGTAAAPDGPFLPSMDGDSPNPSIETSW
uniref:Putative secreted protein n=1 Tax=Ixodes ricinus TaxID=34613 RepID=A0A6B0UHI8_IXORI